MAWNTQCVYEFGQHTTIGQGAGLSDAQIYATTRPIEEGPWEATQVVVLRMVDEPYVDDCLTEETWSLLIEYFSTEEVLAYVAAPLAYRMAAGVFNSCGIQLDEGIPGWPSPPRVPNSESETTNS